MDPPRGHLFYIDPGYRKKLKRRPRPLILDMQLYLVLSRPLPRLFKLELWDQKCPGSGGHLFYIDTLYREKL